RNAEMFNIHHKPGWSVAERDATPETMYLNRRSLLAGIGGCAMAGLSPIPLRAQESDPSAHLYPAALTEKYVLDRELTPEEINGRFNNFYEFGSHKNIASAAQSLPIRPWEIVIDGLVEQPVTI